MTCNTSHRARAVTPTPTTPAYPTDFSSSADKLISILNKYQIPTDKFKRLIKKLRLQEIEKELIDPRTFDNLERTKINK